MHNNKIIRYLMVAVVLFSVVFGTASVYADSYEGLDTIMTVSPPKQRIALVPGEDYEGYIMVSSSQNAKLDLVYSVTIGSFGLGKDENGNTDYNDTDVDTVTSYNQIMEWIELKKDKGTVERGNTETIPFVIHVPKSAPAGGQYATIIVQNDTESESGENGNVNIVSKVRFASSIFAEVAGETIDDGEILENTIPSFILTNQLAASSLVKNNGNVHTDAEYVLQVWPLFSDEEYCTNEEKVETSMVMPGTERYHTQTCNLPSIGIFKAKQTVKIFGETSIVERTVIMCPIWLLFLVIFGITAIIIYFVARAKARKAERHSAE